MGSGNCFVGLSHGIPENRVPMAQQWDCSEEHWHWGMFPFEAQEVAVVETPSLRCFQHV